VLDFLRSCLAVLSSRWKIIVIFNLLFFGCLLVFLLISMFVFPQTSSYAQPAPQRPVDSTGWFSLGLNILLGNLIVSFVFVILPGTLLFPLSMVDPLYNAAVWGALSYSLGDIQFFTILPTFILEGEALILSATAATILGCAWLKPDWVHPDEHMPRLDSFSEALHEEALKIYFIVILLLLTAATVETGTIFLAT